MLLHLSITFLDQRYHGRGDRGQPEWPPSPLRLFQAIVAASAAGNGSLGTVAESLRFLENLDAPTVIAPTSRLGVPYRLSVPNNAMDLVAKAWSAGNYDGGGDANPATHRTMKTVCAMHMLDGDTVYYLWRLPEPPSDADRKHAGVLTAAVRSVVALGWGIDLGVGQGAILSEEQAAQIPGERWLPAESRQASQLRTPVRGTLDDVLRRHQAFLTRVSSKGLTPVPPLSAFRVVGYRRSTEPAGLPYAAFSIFTPDGSRNRAFDAPRRTTCVAGMVRHALAERAKVLRPLGWTDDDICTIVQGHAPGKNAGPAHLSVDSPRFSYLPLPSIEPRGDRGRCAGMIRRVLIAGRPGMEDAIEWVRRALCGAELIDEHTSELKGILSLLPADDWVTRQYCAAASSWVTVTPVVIPGHDDRSDSKTGKLIRKALLQAGFSQELVTAAHLDWRSTGFLPGVELASRYRRPQNTSQAPVKHLRIDWREKGGNPLMLAGPIAIGSGRFRGLGLLVST